MDQAQKNLRTDPSTAIGIFRALRDTKDFAYRDYCGQQHAVSLQITGQYDRALEEFEQLLDESEQDKTPLRAVNLRLAAETAVALGRTDNVSEWLQEAEQIFESIRDFHNVGQVMRLRGVMETLTGNLVKGQEHIKQGTRIISDHRSGVTNVDTTRINVPTSATAGTY